VDRHAGVIQALLNGDGPLDAASLLGRVCDLCVRRLSLSAITIVLGARPQSRQLLAAGGRLAGQVEELQFALGEGPCVEAFEHGAPVLEPDLASRGVARWPGFARAALALGVGAVFALPLRVGAARVGALDMARDIPGPLGAEGLAEALVLAEVATSAVLFLQSGAPVGTMAATLSLAGSNRIVVHQATGMVSVQLGVTVGDALARLRGFAVTADRPLEHVAADVVARKLRFDE
jgi:GAF domain-containing protein